MKRNFKKYFLFFSLLCLAQGIHAQSDTTGRDSLYHSPKKATWLSVALPGAGQFYNKKYWKIPIIYAGFGALGYAFSFNHGEYKRFGNYYKQATDDDPDTNPDFPGSAEQLRGKRNYYKKYRDLSVIGMAGLYALQILDANVDAHLAYFDISDDLSLFWYPSLLASPVTAKATPGLSLQLVF